MLQAEAQREMHRACLGSWGAVICTRRSQLKTFPQNVETTAVTVGLASAPGTPGPDFQQVSPNQLPRVPGRMASAPQVKLPLSLMHTSVSTRLALWQKLSCHPQCHFSHGLQFESRLLQRLRPFGQ